MYVESKICFIRRYGILFCFKPLLEAALNILQRKDTLIFCPIYVMQTNKSKEMDILSRSIPIHVHFSYQDVDAKSLLMTVVFCQQQQKIFSRAKNSFHVGWSKTRNSIASQCETNCLKLGRVSNQVANFLNLNVFVSVFTVDDLVPLSLIPTLKIRCL